MDTRIAQPSLSQEVIVIIRGKSKKTIISTYTTHTDCEEEVPTAQDCAASCLPQPFRAQIVLLSCSPAGSSPPIRAPISPNLDGFQSLETWGNGQGRQAMPGQGTGKGTAGRDGKWTCIQGKEAKFEHTTRPHPAASMRLCSLCTHSFTHWFIYEP